MDPDPSSTLFTDLNLVSGIAALILLLVCSAVMSGAEVALFSLSPDDIDKIKNKSPRKAGMLTSLLEKPRKLLATIVISNNVANIAFILLCLRLSADWFSALKSSGLQLTLQFAVTAFLLLLFGEVMPKVYAGRNSLRFSIRVVYILYFVGKLLSPLSIPMREAMLWMQKKFGIQKSNLSVDQLSQALELTDYGNSTNEEQRLLEGIVSFGNTDVKQVMCPRVDIFALDIDDSFAEILPKIMDKGFSRIPVYKDNIDRIEGVLFIKDLIPHIDTPDFKWQEILREPFFVPENKKLDNLLKEFQKMKNHLAIVVDEYGGTSGLISLEDILEEIVGDISDEFDDEDIFYSRIDEHNFVFDGKINIKDFCRVTDCDEDDFEEAKGESETLAGFLLELSGNFPRKGQKINFKGNIFTVESVDKRRIHKIKVTLKNT